MLDIVNAEELQVDDRIYIENHGWHRIIEASAGSFTTSLMIALYKGQPRTRVKCQSDACFKIWRRNESKKVLDNRKRKR